RQVVPGISRLAVILAYRPPLALAEIRTPFLPGHVLLARGREPGCFGTGLHVHVRHRPFRAGTAAALPPARSIRQTHHAEGGHFRSDTANRFREDDMKPAYRRCYATQAPAPAAYAGAVAWMR